MNFIRKISKLTLSIILTVGTHLSAEPQAVGAKPEYGIASLLSFAPKDMVESVREGSADPLVPIPENSATPTAPLMQTIETASVPTSASVQVVTPSVHEPVAVKPQVAAPAPVPAGTTWHQTLATSVKAEQDLKRIENRLAKEQRNVVHPESKTVAVSKPISRLLASIGESKSNESLNVARRPASREEVVTVAHAKSTDLQAVLAYHLAPRGSSKRQLQSLEKDAFEVARPKVQEEPGTVSRVRVFTEISAYNAENGGSRFRRVDTSGSADSQTRPNDSVDALSTPSGH